MRLAHRSVLPCLAIFCLMTLQSLAGTPAAPITVSIEQPDGTRFEALPKGNYFTNWMETRDGHTIVKGNDQVWYYANSVLNGQLMPSNVAVGAGRAPVDARGLRPQSDPATFEDYGHPRQLPIGPGKGATTQPILTLLVSFADTTFTHSAASFETLMFGATDSVKDFYLENSYNQFTITPATETQGTANDGIIEVTLGSNHPSPGTNTTSSRAVAISAVTAANAFIDYASYDTNGDGDVSASELSIVLILAGYENAFGGASSLTPRVWGHKSSFSTTTLDGVDLSPYTMFGEKHATSLANSRQATIGIMCHELGHLMLDLPDLYDRDSSSRGIGDWCLMAGGTWNATGGESGDTPAHFSAWCKVTIGMVTPDDISTTQNGVVIDSADQSASIKRLWVDPYKVGEHFLVSRRAQSSYDGGLPGAGVMIWHIDPSVGTQNDDETHKLVDLESADGSTHMDSNSNSGDGGDTYPGTSSNTTFNDTSTPNSKDYDGASTGVSVTNITSGASYTADFTGGTTSGDHLAYFNRVTGNIVGYNNAIAWTGIRFTNTTAYDQLDGFEVYLWANATVDFYLYESMTGSTPTNLLHSQTGFAGVPGFNRFMLDTAQTFPISDDRVMVLRINAPGELYPLAFDSTSNTGRSYIDSNGSGSFASYNDFNQRMLLSSAACSAPSVTDQPVGDTICAGENHTFTVTASGDGLSYQWKKDGVDVDGATSASLTINSATTGDAGSYTCVVTGTCGDETTSGATLTVNTTTAISAQPSGDTICVGENHTFSATASGTGLSYQWKKNGSDVDGATSSSLTINSASTGDAGSYTCVITGTCGEETTSAAVLTVNDATAISAQPSGNTICVGEDHTFSVTASGTSISYQWKKGGVDIDGATNSSYSISDASTDSSGTYTCTITGTCGTETTSDAVLTVNPTTAITSEPENQEVCDSDDVTFSVTATGSGLSYQWKKNGVDIGGATSSSYTVFTAIAEDEGSYTCTITGDCGSTTSAAATLTLVDGPSITTQPIGRSVCTGDAVSFSVVATGSNLSYQWNKGGIPLAGATSSTYNIPAATLGSVGAYNCTITSSCGEITSSSVGLMVSNRPTVNTDPADADLCVGDALNLSVSASGDGLSYQWQKNNSDIIGATNATYSIASVTSNDAAEYRCVVTGTCDTATSETAIVTVSPLTAITSQPQSLTRCETGTATFTVGATGSNLTYQWYEDGDPLGGETTNTLTLDNLAGTDDGKTYNCEVVGDCGTEWTETVILTIDAGGAFQLFVAPENPVQGNDVITLTGSISCGEDPLTFEWVNLTTDAVVGDQANLVLDPIPTETTTYRLTVTDNLAQTDTQEVTVLVSEVTIDVNGDGSNTIEDLWEVGTEWTESENPVNDADGDGRITILDLLYVRID